MALVSSTELIEKSITKPAKKPEALKDLILYNDDVNTFDFVTDSLIEVCEHNPLQAEQCTYLVHYTGKCVVKSGTFKKLKPLCEGLLDRGLTARIEN